MRGVWGRGSISKVWFSFFYPRRILQPNTFKNRKSALRSGILFVSTEVMHRPRSGSSLHFVDLRPLLPPDFVDLRPPHPPGGEGEGEGKCRNTMFRDSKLANSYGKIKC